MMIPMPLKAIAAMSLNRVIGRGNSIPWDLPEDFEWFKKTTMGHVLVMGRRTFESIGRPLPGRETIVLTGSGEPIAGVRTVGSLDALGKAGDLGDRTIFICGGAQVYAQLLDQCWLYTRERPIRQYPWYNNWSYELFGHRPPSITFDEETQWPVRVITRITDARDTSDY